MDHTIAMTRAQTIDVLRRHEADIRARGVTQLAVFGSTARGTAATGSDVDVVVDIEPGRKFSLIDHASLRVLLCDILGREVDVVIRDSLRPEFREEITKDAVRVMCGPSAAPHFPLPLDQAQAVALGLRPPRQEPY